MQWLANDLILVSISAVVSAILTLLTALPPVRVIGALPLVLFLPGYAFVAACLPQRSFNRVERLLLSVGTSVALTILLGLALYWAHVNLQTTAWAGALAVIVLLASAIARLRRKRLAQIEALSPTTPIRLKTSEIVLMGVAAVIAGIAIHIAQLPTPPDNVSGYTQLWLIPTASENSTTYQLGVTSQEFGPVTYHLQVLVNGQVGWDWPDVQLQPGESWTSPIALQAGRADAGSVEAVLYRTDAPTTIYRQVKLQHPG